MRIAVLGTGSVGMTVGSRLLETGHEVRMGSRTAGNERAVAWVQAAGGSAGEGTFADAASWAEVVVNATGGLVSIEALTAAGAANLAGKPLLDVSNPLDFSGGFPPKVAQPDGRSLGELIQETFPAARVVKTLNTMTADVMVHPRALPGAHSVFLAGDDAAAKDVAAGLLRGFGWAPEEIVDVGGIEAARGLELYLPLWLTLMGTFGSPAFNVSVVRAEPPGARA
ncbi:MAG TPA: NAD(P)-binding domain-containing protein [Candidatus Angelobacter sp.]|nr:NAD(P)-binding domain-containing protein [Candidatus Angelobacter sp.]